MSSSSSSDDDDDDSNRKKSPRSDETRSGGTPSPDVVKTRLDLLQMKFPNKVKHMKALQFEVFYILILIFKTMTLVSVF